MSNFTTSSASYSTSTSSYSSSSTSNNINGQTTGHASTTHSITNPDGTTTIQRSHQNLGDEAPRVESRTFDREGRQVIVGTVEEAGRIEDGSAQAVGSGPVIEDVTDTLGRGGQEERDRAYEEAMEDEYAKREGGA